MVTLIFLTNFINPESEKKQKKQKQTKPTHHRTVNKKYCSSACGKRDYTEGLPAVQQGVSVACYKVIPQIYQGTLCLSAK